MDVKVFKTFLEVANTRHFGRAAENLYITQAAVSARIKQLEEFVNATLFERNRNNISLTEAGERLLPYATTMVRAIQQAKNEINLAEFNLAQISIAAPPSVWDAFLQQALPDIVQQLPEVALVTEIQNLRHIQTTLAENTLDLAFSFEPFNTADMQSENVANIELVLVSTEAMDVDTAFKQGYIFVDWGTQFHSEHDIKYGRHVVHKLKTPNGRIALEHMLAHGGSAFLPVGVVEPLIASGALCRVKGKHVLSRSVYATFRRYHPNAEVLERILAVFEQSTQSN